MLTRPAVIAVVGATATGKSALGEALAASLDAEVVCCDSRQVFAELEIGTGKPTPAERALRPHHLFDALRLGQAPSAGWYARAAGAVCEDIRSRGRLPLLVGGSGLYLRALREGLAPTPPHDPAVRRRLVEELGELGPESLHRRLAAVDPGSASRIDPRDGQRITRALEVHAVSGRPLSWWHAQEQEGPPAEAWVVLDVMVAPAVLRSRIARRTSVMFAEGLLDETRALLEQGLGPALTALRAIGYDEAMAVLEGRLERPEAEHRVNLRTSQLAKRQRTWFRHQVQGVPLAGGDEDPGVLRRAAIDALRRAGCSLP